MGWQALPKLLIMKMVMVFSYGNIREKISEQPLCGLRTKHKKRTFLQTVSSSARLVLGDTRWKHRYSAVERNNEHTHRQKDGFSWRGLLYQQDLSSGYVFWLLKVGGRISFATFKIVVEGGEKVSVEFTVVQ